MTGSTMTIISQAEMDAEALRVSVRDAYAAAALNGLLSSGYSDGHDHHNRERLAKDSLAIADAMMEAR